MLPSFTWPQVKAAVPFQQLSSLKRRPTAFKGEAKFCFRTHYFQGSSRRRSLCCSNVASKPDNSERLKQWKEGRERKQLVRNEYFEKLAGTAVLESVRVVLVAPKFSANVGSAARLCSNFECNDLHLVAPRCEPQNDEARALSVGSPALNALTTSSTLTEAVQDCTVTIGFTRRQGNSRHVYPSFRRLLEEHPEYLDPSRGRLALVFGREDSGLEVSELRSCSALCALPTGRVQPSLNLSHSAGIALAHCFESRVESIGGLPGDSDMLPEDHPSHISHAPPQGWPPATSSEVECLLDRFKLAMGALGLPTEEEGGGGTHYRRRKLLGHLRSVFSRASVNSQEVKSIHGLISAILKSRDLSDHEH